MGRAEGEHYTSANHETDFRVVSCFVSCVLLECVTFIHCLLHIQEIYSHTLLSILLHTDFKKKKGVDLDAGRRRREDTTIQLRKSKKEEQLAKRRAGNKNTQKDQRDQERLPTLADIPRFLRTMQDASATAPAILNAVRSIRRMTSVEPNPPIKQLLHSGVLPFLVRFLGYDAESMVQFETAWALTNVAATEYTAQVVEAGATPGLIRLLECPAANVREQAAWCLGNIAGDSPKFRDFVLKSGALPPV